MSAIPASASQDHLPIKPLKARKCTERLISVRSAVAENQHACFPPPPRFASLPTSIGRGALVAPDALTPRGESLLPLGGGLPLLFSPAGEVKPRYREDRLPVQGRTPIPAGESARRRRGERAKRNGSSMTTEQRTDAYRRQGDEMRAPGEIHKMYANDLSGRFRI